MASLVAAEGQASSVADGTLTPDSFLSTSQERSPGVLKVDVEGAERAVLKGGIGILSTPAPPVLLLEMEDTQSARHGTSKAEIQEMLRRLGFVAFQLRGCRWVACDDVRQARCRNILWVNPAVGAHRVRMRAARLADGSSA